MKKKVVRWRKIEYINKDGSKIEVIVKKHVKNEEPSSVIGKDLDFVSADWSVQICNNLEKKFFSITLAPKWEESSYFTENLEDLITHTLAELTNFYEKSIDPVIKANYAKIISDSKDKITTIIR